MHLKKRTDTYETILCPFCGSSINHDDQFCPSCGKEITDSVKNEMALNNENRKLIAQKKKKIIIISSVFTVGIGLCLVFAFVGIPAIQNSIATNKITAAYQDFSEEKLSYEEADRIINTYSKSKDPKIEKVYTSNHRHLSALNSSRKNYEAGIEEAENKNYQSAIINLKKVIDTDKNYADAQNRISSILESWKTALLEEIKVLEKNRDYSTAINKLSIFNSYSSDRDISAIITVLKSKLEQQRIEEYKNNQEVKVMKQYAFNDGNYIVSRKARIIFQNCTDKVLKTANMIILQYDDNGYPVDGEYEMYRYGDVPNSMCATANSVNIAKGKSFGEQWAWDIAERATKIKAIVYEAEYTDGSTWKNPYVEYWLNAEKDRY